MVRYFGPLATSRNIRDVRKLIHEGQVLELGCLILAKNRPEVILDDRKLDDARFDYLVPFETTFFPFIAVHLSMWSHAVPIGSVDSLASVSKSPRYF